MRDICFEVMQTGFLECNTIFIFSEQTKAAMIIDPGEEASIILQKVKELHLNVKILLHTHAHIDHIGSSKILQKELKSRIYLHKNDEELYQNLPLQGFMFGRNADTPAIVDWYFQDGDDIVFEEKYLIKVIHTPGHSEGSCCFFTEMTDSPILFSGDTLFKNSVGRADLPGGNLSALIPAIKEKLFPLPENTKIIPGHGPFTTLAEEKNHNPCLQDEFHVKPQRKCSGTI